MSIKQNTAELQEVLNIIANLPDAGGGSSGGSTDELMIAIAERTLTDLVLPEGVVDVSNNAFYSWKTLKTVSFPSTLERVGMYSFRGASFEELVFPAKLKTLDGYAFDGNSSLLEVTFKGTPTTFKSTTFSSCSKLATINVPWAEGTVSGAPWGATNATVNYNYAE